MDKKDKAKQHKKNTIEETLRKYYRIQEFYKNIKSYGCFAHQFCEELTRQFFHIRGKGTIDRIITEEVPESIKYDHIDLDKNWIRDYIQIHIKIKENA